MRYRYFDLIPAVHWKAKLATILLCAELLFIHNYSSAQSVKVNNLNGRKPIEFQYDTINAGGDTVKNKRVFYYENNNASQSVSLKDSSTYTSQPNMAQGNDSN